MIQSTLRNKASSLRNFSSDDVLAALGLERRRGAAATILPAVGYFAAGAAVGAGISLLLAPKSGQELRTELGGKARHAKETALASAERVAGEAQAFLPKRNGSGPNDATSKKSAQTT